MLRCDKSLVGERSRGYVVHRSNAAPGRAVCFLGRFLPKLGGASCAAIFCFPKGSGAFKRETWRTRACFHTMSRSTPSAETPAGLRATARLAREFSQTLHPSDENARRLLELAAELEARADALERQKPPNSALGQPFFGRELL